MFGRLVRKHRLSRIAKFSLNCIVWGFGCEANPQRVAILGCDRGLVAVGFLLPGRKKRIDLQDTCIKRVFERAAFNGGSWSNRRFRLHRSPPHESYLRWYARDFGHDGQTVGAGGEWTFAHGADEVAAMGFNTLHVDSPAWSIGLGVIFCALFRWVAVRASATTPSGLINFVEMIVEFIDNQVKDTFHGNNKLIAPLSLTVPCGSS